MAHIIVVGNEKGGAGKSTVSMHIATALARMGHKVGALHRICCKNMEGAKMRVRPLA